jgi:hypothetical protein
MQLDSLKMSVKVIVAPSTGRTRRPRQRHHPAAPSPPASRARADRRPWESRARLAVGAGARTAGKESGHQPIDRRFIDRLTATAVRQERLGGERRQRLSGGNARSRCFGNSPSTRSKSSSPVNRLTKPAASTLSARSRTRCLRMPCWVACKRFAPRGGVGARPLQLNTLPSPS